MEAEELPNDAEARLDGLEAAIAAIEERSSIYALAEVACAGAFLSIGHDGILRVERGFIRPDAAAGAHPR